MSASSKEAETRTSAPLRPLKCLVIQLTRLGDTLQSLMALRAAKQLYPGLEITFVAREKFSAAAKRVPWIEKVVTFPSESILGPVLLGKKTEVDALSDLARWLAPLVKDPWDLVVNWSYSESSSYLTALLPARVKLGYSRQRDTTFSAVDGWSHYIQAIVQEKVDQNIHLTDILTTQLLTALQIHIGEPADEGDAPVTSKSFFTLELGEEKMGWSMRDLTRKWIAVQLGASQPAKAWDPEKWARTLQLILQKHPDHGFVLLGDRSDIPRARGVIAKLEANGVETQRNVVSLAGESDFDLWASVIARCQWVLSCDTAALHLASVLGTRVLDVSVGPVRWAETGPYGNGHYIVSSAAPCDACETGDTKARAHSCRETVTPEAVYGAWSYATTEWSHRKLLPIADHFERIGMKSHLENVRIHRSTIRNTQDGGGVVYEPLIPRPLLIGEWMSMAMGHIARAWYCGWVPPVGQELKRAAISPALIQALRQLDESSVVLSKISEEASKTAASLNQRASTLKSDKVMPLKDREEIRKLGKKLSDLELLAERLGKTILPLQGLIGVSQVQMHNLKGNQIAELGRQAAECYRQTSEGTAILREWIKFTQKLSKPVAIRNKPEVLA